MKRMLSVFSLLIVIGVSSTVMSTSLVINALPCPQSQRFPADYRILKQSGPNMRRQDLVRADLKGANLKEADLSCTNLTGANLEGADLRGAAVYFANLTQVNLTKANLQGAKLFGAELTEANLTEANLQGVKLFAADLTDVIFCRTIMPDGTTNNLGCNFANFHKGFLERGRKSR